jgi:hypothetical protein
VVERLGQHLRLLDSARLSAVAGSISLPELPASRGRSGGGQGRSTIILLNLVGEGLATGARRIRRIVDDPAETQPFARRRFTRKTG